MRQISFRKLKNTELNPVTVRYPIPLPLALGQEKVLDIALHPGQSPRDPSNRPSNGFTVNACHGSHLPLFVCVRNGEDLQPSMCHLPLGGLTLTLNEREGKHAKGSHCHF